MRYHLFISLAYILASGSTEVRQEEKRGWGTSGVSSTSETRKFKGNDKRKITFLSWLIFKKLVIAACTLRNYPLAWYFKDGSCKISLQTWRTSNLSPKIGFLS